MDIFGGIVLPATEANPAEALEWSEHPKQRELPVQRPQGWNKLSMFLQNSKKATLLESHATVSLILINFIHEINSTSEDPCGTPWTLSMQNTLLECPLGT